MGSRQSVKSPLVVLTGILAVCGVAVAVGWVHAVGGLEALGSLPASAPAMVPILVLASGASMGLRFVRWQYLLRRVGVRIPTRPSLSIYLASLAGTATPAYLGEVVRAYLIRRRSGPPLRLTLSALVFERLLDVAALGIIGLSFSVEERARWIFVSAMVAAVVACLVAAAIGRAANVPSGVMRALVAPGSLVKSLAMSLAVWGFAACVLLAAAGATGIGLGPRAAADTFALSTLVGGSTLSPAGIGATGSSAILRLEEHGVAVAAAVVTVTLLRIATTGLWLAVSCVFLVRELRARGAPPASTAAEHFDEVAGDYERQFSEHVWEHLLTRKVDMIASAVGDRARGGPGIGLDIGCGLGHQLRAMRSRGYRVVGVDPAVKLLRPGHERGLPVVAASALQLPFRDASIEFAYAIGVLHHLADTATQDAACREILRVLAPGGRLVVHETNPKSPLFSLYMGYVFPILRTIDEGTEWWIREERWHAVRGFRHVETCCFTFLPDFLPNWLNDALRPLERSLERGPLRRYSAHYVAVLERLPEVAPANTVAPRGATDDERTVPGGEGEPAGRGDPM